MSSNKLFKRIISQHSAEVDAFVRMELCNAANNDIDSVIKQILNISM